MNAQSIAKRALSSTLRTVLGRRNYARLARFLWMQSRLDLGYDIRVNGELEVMKGFAARVASSAAITVLDVGANMGQWTAAMLECIAEARGHCRGVHMHLFEPVPATHELLRANRLGDGNTDITLNRVAVGDTPGQASMAIFEPTAGIHSLKAMPGDSPRERVSIDVTTIDAYVAERGIQIIDLLKIDTEGNDLNVLRGAQSTLEQRRIQYIQFEYNHRWIAFRHFLKDAFDYLQPLGYQIGKITPLGVEAYRSWDPELESFREGNYLAWREPNLPIPIIPWWNESPL